MFCIIVSCFLLCWVRRVAFSFHKNGINSSSWACLFSCESAPDLVCSIPRPGIMNSQLCWVSNQLVQLIYEEWVSDCSCTYTSLGMFRSAAMLCNSPKTLFCIAQRQMACWCLHPPSLYQGILGIFGKPIFNSHMPSLPTTAMHSNLEQRLGMHWVQNAFLICF